MVPAHLLIHTVTVVEPAETTDTYGNAVYDYDAGTRTAIAAWLQQDERTEQFRDGRDPLDERWLMVTNYETVSGLAHIEWDDHPAGPVVFTVDGPTEPAYTPAGFHHTEARLRVVTG